MSLFEDDEKTSSSTMLLWLVVIAFLGVLSWYGWYVFKKDGEDRVTLCPNKGPTAHYVVLIDNTSPFPFNQKAALSQRIKTMVLTKVPTGALVSVFLLGEDYQNQSTPVFEKCKPTQWNDDMKLVASKRLVEKEYDQKFAKPLNDVIKQIQLDQKAKTSPIFEMLQLVGIKGFAEANVKGPRHLIIYSDMVANMPQFNMYTQKLPAFKDFANTPYGQNATAKTLEGAVVTFNMLATEPNAAPYRMRSDFWSEYLEENHATLDEFNPMEGL
ncbi:hypothetical protein FHW75_005037 [Pseudomonas sp. OG7]|uniref:hypothetical protein n=1 Tax=Pseudomonas sp. OG7 TaxID=2587037 RepID=UPI0016128021|nr:hypothetical protein [Pseudomonas sp. OG7]MBB3273824.1 hypothetical protein [Pseudomonas sp. OG7]